MQINHETVRLAVDLWHNDQVSLAEQPKTVSPAEEPRFSLLFTPDLGTELKAGFQQSMTKLMVRNLTKSQLKQLAEDILRSL